LLLNECFVVVYFDIDSVRKRLVTSSYIRMVTPNVLCKQWRGAGRGWSSSLVLGCGL